MRLPLVPRYGAGTLADLLPSIGAHLGVAGTSDRLDVPAAGRYVVLLVDGLGAEQLCSYAAEAPYLAGLGERTITSCVPSTTATSITSLGTGLPPGAHGVAGYSFWYPPIRDVLTTLRWPSGISGEDVQPQLTWFERLERAGVACGTIAPANFAGSGLTTAALRGPRFWPVRNEADLAGRVDLAVASAGSGERTVTYCYERALDHAGHPHGVGSRQWLAALAGADELARRLRLALDDSVRLVITGDHGMVNVPSSARLIVEDVPGLLHGVTAFAGEGRLRQLMVAEGAAEAVASRWREELGERAWVRTRDEAVAEGWFGELAPRFADRFGDVLVAMADDGAVMSRKLPKELTLVGMHGSLTEAEMVVPLLID
jgi:hypothetical protein